MSSKFSQRRLSVPACKIMTSTAADRSHLTKRGRAETTMKITLTGKIVFTLHRSARLKPLQFL